MIDGFRFGSDTTDAFVGSVRFDVDNTENPGGCVYTFLYSEPIDQFYRMMKM
jgi:hypothetical protein